jgi:hypothetical protein
MVIFPVIKFFYFLPGVVYNGVPLLNNQMSFYAEPAQVLARINKENDKHWSEILPTQK